MKLKKISYRNKEWYEFSKRVKLRDQNRCLKCGRSEPDVVLQVHHKIYKPNLKPWEYSLSDCITLCKGCHSREHGIIEPNNGWTLISIEDLGGLYGVCERKGCGTDIRYEHITYHPKWGYKSVGSTCIEYLTQEDQFISKEVLKVLKKISGFINKSIWEKGITKKGKEYISTKHSHHKIRIYGKKNNYFFQIILKEKGVKWYNYGDFINAKNKSLEQVKELAYIVLKGLTSKNKKEIELLRNIYKRIK